MKSSFSSPLTRWVAPGLFAGCLFLAVALIAGAVTTSLWAMPDAIAQTVGVAAPADYRFALAPVAIGVFIHLALSVGLGALFMALTARRQLNGGMLILASCLFITLETPIVLWGMLHSLLSAATFHYYLAAIPFWGSLAGHYLYAVGLGAMLARRAVRTPTAQPASA
jgi:hypothetical protein